MFLTNTFSKNNKKICKSLKILVTPIGFEPITCPLGGKTILIISPTSAIGWYFNENEWKKNILSFLKENLSDGLFKKIKIRNKPNEPIVDMTGKYLGLKQNSSEKQVPIEEDLENASIIIAYNSQVAI